MYGLESFEKNKGNGGKKKREIEKVVTKNTVESLYSNNQHWRLLINSNKKMFVTIKNHLVYSSS